MSVTVPNKFPSVPPKGARLAVIGQSPGEREVEQGEPFVGPAGQVLTSLLEHAGISREMCFIGNVSQHRPRGNDFNTFDWEGSEVQDGIAALRADLLVFQPTMVLCLGNEALHLFKHGNMAPKKIKQQGKWIFKWPSPISSWRGSLFESNFLQAGWSSPVAHQAHNLKVTGSNPVPASILDEYVPDKLSGCATSGASKSGDTDTAPLPRGENPLNPTNLSNEEQPATPAIGSEQGVAFPPSSSLRSFLPTGLAKPPETCESGLKKSSGKPHESVEVAAECLAPNSPCRVDNNQASGFGEKELAADDSNLQESKAPLPAFSPSFPGESASREAGGGSDIILHSSPASLEGQGQPLPLLKCVATYHPAFLLRNWDAQVYVKHDIRMKVMPEFLQRLGYKGLAAPKREVYEVRNFMEALNVIRSFRGHSLVSVDTEGWCSGISHVGLSTHPNSAWVICFSEVDGTSNFTAEQEVELWQALKELFEDPQVPKIFQNYLSDAFVLAWTYGIVLQGVAHDTLLLAWEAECEVDKDLATLASLYTREPFWKSKENYQKRLAWVCGVDAAVTLEVAQVLLRKIYGPDYNFETGTDTSLNRVARSASPGGANPQAPDCGRENSGEGQGEPRANPARYQDTSFAWMTRPRDHYEFNMDCLTPVLYMMLRGFLFDKEGAKKEAEALLQELYTLQGQIDEASGRALRVEDILPAAIKAFSRKNPKERVEVPRWQPMRHNGKKWVKDGALLDYKPPPYEFIEQATVPAISEHRWLKPAKPAKKLKPVLIDSWSVLLANSKPSCTAKARQAFELYKQLDISRSSSFGELGLLLGTSCNVNSTGQGKDAQWLLYDCWKLPKRFKKGAKPGEDREGAAQQAQREDGLTSDDEALLNLYLLKQDERLKLVLRMRALVKEISYLRVQTDPDGRVRSRLNLLATPTGRMSSSKSPTGTSKLNLQTITKRLRHLFPADKGCLLFQRDLSGADGWTVACHCASLGDSTMLEDFKAKLKPQSILALIYKMGPQVNSLDRETLRSYIREHVNEASWQYMAFKRVFHLSDYAGAPKKMSESILTDSWKKGGEPIYVDPKTCEDMQQKAFHIRYRGVKEWHREWEGKLLSGQAMLETSYGHRHSFHGRKKEWSKKRGRWVACGETHRYALACEAQLNTTHALKRALWRQWHDPENYLADGSLRAEPLMLVHDSKIMQAREEDREWALAKDKEWFNNPFTIAGITVTIPASSEIGKDWGMKP